MDSAASGGAIGGRSKSPPRVMEIRPLRAISSTPNGRSTSSRPSILSTVPETSMMSDSGATSTTRARKTLIKVSADRQNRPHLMELIKVFRARVVDVAPESLIIEVSGTVDKIDGLLEVLRPFGVLEMARSGRISMTRGGDLLRPPIAPPEAAEAIEAESQ